MKETGFKDKNGTMIKDGDYIRNYQTGEKPNIAGEVFFEYDEWCFNCYHAGALPLKRYCMDSVIVASEYE